MRLATVVLMTLATASPALAWDDEFRHGRIRYLEPGAVLQRASEASAEEAVTNLPFLPGDRIWTDGGGRVEFQFSDGSVLRLDSRSKLDYLAHDEGRDDRVVLRLWSGSAFLNTRDGSFADFEIETPTALVTTRDLGSFRIDVDPGETRLSVFDGSASLEAARRSVVVEAGERSWASRGGTPESPRRFDRRASDDFERWNEERDERVAWSGGSSGYLPDEIDPYASELESHGSWYFVAEVGHVWRPYVASGWRPYSDGRWIWTSYGWTWVPNESWGWAPFHYGRWGYSEAVGWYWIPDRTWGPAWVSWAVGGDYVGWCPLGYRNRPVDVVLPRRDLGRAVPRGSSASQAVPRDSFTSQAQQTTAWAYARRSDLSASDLPKRSLDSLRPEVTREVRVIDSARARPTRDFRVVDVDAALSREGSVPRNVKVKPTPGDTVPELRGDNQTTIPAPILRRPQPGADDIRYDRGREATQPQAPRAEPRDSSQRWVEREAEPARDTSRSREVEKTREVERAPQTERERSTPQRNEPDRDVLRRIFSPLSQPHASEPRSSEPRSAVPRSEPRVSAPRSDPPRPAPAAPPPTKTPAPRPRKDHN